MENLIYYQLYPLFNKIFCRGRRSINHISLNRFTTLLKAKLKSDSIIALTESYYEIRTYC